VFYTYSFTEERDNAMAMAAYESEERRQVLEWFETDFKNSAKSTTRTQRLEDGKVGYRFSVVNNSGYDFGDFSFKVKILNKVNGREIGTATIRAGEWAAGETKNFRSRIAIPQDVRSISFVMFSDSVDFTIDEDRRDSGYIGRQDPAGSAMDDIRELGEMVTGADGSGGILGELFGTGGMPETTVTKTTTTRTPSGTTTTRTTTTTSRDGKVRKETTTTRQTAGQQQRQAQQRQAQQSQPESIGQTFAKRRLEKKLNKIRLGKSAGALWSALGAAMFAMAALGSTGDPATMTQYTIIGAGLAALAAGIKIFANRKGKLIRDYESKINYNGNTSLEMLAQQMGRSVEKVADDLQKMIIQGFLEGAYVDIKNKLLVMTKNGEPIESVEKSAAANRTAKRKAAREKGVVPESIDDLITMTDDGEIKGKLRSLRTITNKIDQRIEERPELEDQVKDFREKYYPEVVRLTDEYNEKIANLGTVAKEEKVTENPLEINTNPNYLEEQAQDIKKQLISLIDSVTEASENLLERLHEDDIMDISTDIKMLQTTLASKGLLDSDFDL
jgi:hypothetical protein